MKTTKQDRPALICTCGCPMQHHMNSKGKIGECRECGLIPGALSFRCRCWNPQRTSVKKLKQTLRAEGLL